jgi:hypothetical protein
MSEPGDEQAARVFGMLSHPAVKSVLSDMRHLLEMDEGAGTSNRTSEMKFAAELLDTDTDDPGQVLKIAAKVLEMQDQRFANLPAGERDQARRDYAASRKEEQNGLAELSVTHPEAVPVVSAMTRPQKRSESYLDTVDIIDTIVQGRQSSLQSQGSQNALQGSPLRSWIACPACPSCRPPESRLTCADGWRRANGKQTPRYLRWLSYRRSTTWQEEPSPGH